MSNENNECFKPFIISTYRSYLSLSLGRTLQIWSIICIVFNVLIYQTTLRNRSGLPYLVYTSDTPTFNYYYFTMLSSSILALLTSVFSTRKLAISCLSLTLVNLVATTIMLGTISHIFTDKSSYGNRCIFESDFFQDWKKPLLTDCSESYSKICVSNDRYYSDHLLRSCGILILEEESKCDDFQTSLMSAGKLDKLVNLCIDRTNYKYQTFLTVLTIYLHYLFMLITAPIGICILRVIYSIYCIVSVGGTGWEHLSAEELLLSPQAGLLSENPIIPFRYSLYGKNFLRV
ncbi:transmembrane domain-containing protein [Cryptosporidium canis]|uniref:Transmembrane domain-containing protein n=1 Tax=Cryptosporidium canis TaxID=195482 RepID=A0A9D5HY70_9CRYT|nr:transmembrane domain-containing protein [Cryptosporidium canis]